MMAMSRPWSIGICLFRQRTNAIQRHETYRLAYGVLGLVLFLAGCFCYEEATPPLQPLTGTLRAFHRKAQASQLFMSGSPDTVIRRILPRLTLEIFPSPQPLTKFDENELTEIIDDLLVSFVRSMAPWYPQAETTLDNILLAGIESNDWYPYSTGGGQQNTTLDFTANTTVLTFKGGVAYFRGVVAPSSSQVVTWVKTALEEELPQTLSNTSFRYVRTAMLTVMTIAPSSTPNQPVSGSNGAQNTQQYKTGGISSKGVISASVIGGFALIAVVIVALFLFRKRSARNAAAEAAALQGIPSRLSSSKLQSSSSGAVTHVGSDVTGTQTIPAQQQPKQSQPTPNLQQPPPTTSSNAPVVLAAPAPLPCMPDDDDASSFTASTRTDHSNMLPPKTGLPKRPIMVSESFERERRMAIRKDMLDSSWNRTNSPSRLQASQARQKVIAENDTVLQPSHFSASGERRIRRTTAFGNEEELDDDDEDNDKQEMQKGEEEEEEWYFTERKEEVGEEGFRFESATGGNDGEEVFLVPPTSPRHNSGSTNNQVPSTPLDDTHHSLV